MRLKDNPCIGNLKHKRREGDIAQSQIPLQLEKKFKESKNKIKFGLIDNDSDLQCMSVSFEIPFK